MDLIKGSDGSKTLARVHARIVTPRVVSIGLDCSLGRDWSVFLLCFGFCSSQDCILISQRGQQTVGYEARAGRSHSNCGKDYDLEDYLLQEIHPMGGFWGKGSSSSPLPSPLSFFLKPCQIPKMLCILFTPGGLCTGSCSFCRYTWFMD